MNKHLIPVAAALLLTGFAATAQDNQDSKTTAKEKQEKKLSEYDEIVIKRKDGDKNAKVTVEINGEDVLINGKPIDDFANDDVSVRLRKQNHFRLDGPSSPFRFQQQWTDEGEEKAFLGVSTEGSSGGARIITISESSAAAKAGLKKGDVITRINDKEVFDHEQVTRIISDLKPEDKITITYKRDGKENKTTATLGKRRSDVVFYNSPGMPNAPFPPNAPFGPNPPMAPMPPMQFDMDGEGFGDIFKYRSGKPRLGIKAQDLEEGKGAKVIDVDEDSPAAKAGLKEDDIITSFDGQDVNSAEELAKASRAAKDKQSIKLQVKRNGKTQSIEVKVPKKLKTAEL